MRFGGKVGRGSLPGPTESPRTGGTEKVVVKAPASPAREKLPEGSDSIWGQSIYSPRQPILRNTGRLVVLGRRSLLHFVGPVSVISTPVTKVDA